MKLLQIFYNKTFFKFIIVGTINTMVGAGSMIALYNVFNVSYLKATVIGNILGSVVSFLLNKYWTFESKTFKYIQVIYFALNIIVCYFIAYGFAKIATTALLQKYSITLQENVAMVIGMVLFTSLNYLSQRFLVFRKGNNKNE